MNIAKKSREYAEGKALKAITSAIEQAYIDGYKDGLQHLENERLESLKTGVTYVDLGLPSGTLWSSRCLFTNKKIEKLPYVEAAKLKIPTIEQYEELYRECKVVIRNFIDPNDILNFEFIGKNGKSVSISKNAIDPVLNFRASFYFWLKDEEEGPEKYCASIWGREDFETPCKHKIFMGIKAPVMLVK